MKKELVFHAVMYAMLIVFISCADASPKQKNPPAFPGFKTDFSKSSIDFSDVISGGPPKDGIPSINNPEFIKAAEAWEWLDPREPVIVAQYPEKGQNAETKIYPLQILMCQQATGEAVAGEMTGTRLEIIPSLTLSFKDAAGEYPDALVLSRDTGITRPYGTNPYEGYDSLAQPFLYRGPEADNTYGMLEQVIAVISGGSFRDRQTGSLWNASGRAVEGVMERSQLAAAAAVQHFWFSYNAFASEYNRQE